MSRSGCIVITLLNLFLVVGCATNELKPPPLETLRAVAVRGTIVEKLPIADSRGIPPAPGIYLPGGGGLVGFAMLELKMSLPRSGDRPAHFIYDIRLKQGAPAQVRVAFIGDLPVGACVEVLADTADPAIKTYNYGYASLRTAEACL